MTTEIHALVETIPATVTKLHGYPLKLVGDSFHVQVYPTGNEVHVTDGVLHLIKSNIKIYIPGTVVRFSNSVTAASGWLEIGKWEILYSFTETVLSNTRPLSITYDQDSGNFVASHPCHAAIKIEPFFAYYDLYSYTPAFGKEVTTFDPWLKKEYKMSSTYYGTAYCIHRFAPELMLPPAVAVFDIPAPTIVPSSSVNLYNTYSITTPTVLTARGEWLRPANWDSPDYDSANAYGTGKAGPSKEDSWVLKNSVIEKGHTTEDGNTLYHTNAVPAVIGYPDVPPDQIVKQYEIKPKPDWMSDAQYYQSQSAAATRIAYHNASQIPDTTIPTSDA